jgi:non-canonical (house-cleaning) NTP pyrophosphatase
MKIILASKSKIKCNALKSALELKHINATLSCLSTNSDVNEQPEGFEETYRGAYNRIINIEKENPDADLYIAIENGIFAANNEEFVDKALIVTSVKDNKIIVPVFESKNISFPLAAVHLARSKGFVLNTVGEALVELKIITNDKDPHLELTGISREDFLIEPLSSLMEYLKTEDFFDQDLEVKDLENNDIQDDESYLLGKNPNTANEEF